MINRVFRDGGKIPVMVDITPEGSLRIMQAYESGWVDYVHLTEKQTLDLVRFVGAYFTGEGSVHSHLRRVVDKREPK